MVMAFDTVRTNKLRSGLTVLGVVIGITSIVAMTALIRGFDSSLQESLRTAMGPQTIFIQRFGITSFASGREFSELIKRPTLDDGRCAGAGTAGVHAGVWSISNCRRGPRPLVQRRISYRDQKTRRDARVRYDGEPTRKARASPSPRAVSFQRYGGAAPQQRRRARIHRYQLLLPEQQGIDPVGKTVRVGSDQFDVVGCLCEPPFTREFLTRPG